MKTEVVVLIVVCIALIFLSGTIIGMTMKREQETKHYFDQYPSPLACHRDGNCGVKPCDLSDYKGDVICK